MKTEVKVNQFGVKITYINASIEELSSPILVDQNNFYQMTVANFKEVSEVDFKADYISNSGSEYMYTVEGVYRRSNHWGVDISTCMWLLNGDTIRNIECVGFCAWSDFKKYAEKKLYGSTSPRYYHEGIADMLCGKMVPVQRLGELSIN